MNTLHTACLTHTQTQVYMYVYTPFKRLSDRDLPMNAFSEADPNWHISDSSVLNASFTEQGIKEKPGKAAGIDRASKEYIKKHYIQFYAPICLFV